MLHIVYIISLSSISFFHIYLFYSFSKMIKMATLGIVMSNKWGFLSGSVLKNPPAKQETWVRSLGQEDPLEKEMETHSSILAREVLWTASLAD